MKLLLASASPRRRELLAQLGVPHEVAVAGIGEGRLPDEGAVECVQRLAGAKAEAVWQQRAGPEVAVLGADTEVELDGVLLGKPRDRAHAVAMLMSLSGRSHRVISAVTLRSARGVSAALSISIVHFAALSRDEAEAYWQTGEPADKAGGYAIQGGAAAFIERLDGSYSGVMGLPLFETAGLLRQAGVRLWQSNRPW